MLPSEDHRDWSDLDGPEATHGYRSHFYEVKTIPRGMYAKNGWPVVYVGNPEQEWFITAVAIGSSGLPQMYSLVLRQPSGEGWGRSKTVSSMELFSEGRMPLITEFAPGTKLAEPKDIDVPTGIRSWIRKRFGL